MITVREYFALFEFDEELKLEALPFSNFNYLTQVIFKCCKLVPVLIGSILIQKKQHGALDFLAAILMCIGLTLFTLGE